MSAFYYVPKEKLVEHSKVAAEAAHGYFSSTLLPFKGWLFGYKKKYIKADITAGLTVAAILVPQVMAYALLAGLPPQVGLYAALVGAVVGALWGSSQHVATGPVAIVSLLTLTTLLPLAEPGSPEFIALAITLAFAVGIVQLGLGFFRFGFLMRLIPHSVLVGFSSAAAIIIAATQVPSLFGYTIVQQEHVFETFIELITHAPYAHALTFAIGFISLVFIFATKKFWPAFPASLVALVVGVAGSYFFNLEALGVAIVGVIPNTIPTPSLEGVSLTTIITLLGGAFIIALIGFMETFAVAKAVAKTTKQKISANQELIGQGAANVASGLFGGYPIAGSFSRTAVNFDAGAKTGVASIVVSIVVLLTLLLLTPYLYYLPKTILAAIVIGAVMQLVHPEHFRNAFRISKTDGTVALITFLTAFAFKPDDAVLVGVILALALFFQRTMWAQVSELGFDHEWGDILRRANTKECIETKSHVLIVRIDLSIFYANAEYVVHQMRELYEKRKKNNDDVKAFVMDFASVNYVDLTGAEVLGEFLNELREAGAEIFIIYAKTRERDALRRAHKEVGYIHFVHNLEELNNSCKECGATKDDICAC
jgi:SulP family sulfate permease